MPEGEGRGRIGVAVSYTNPNKVYALLDHRNKPTDSSTKIEPGAAEVYQSLDGGVSWKKTHTDELMIFAALGWYFADIYVDPKSDDEIYALGIRLAHSVDGGKTFGLVSGDVYHMFPSPADPLHLDHCELWINPTNSSHIVLGNDGGLYVSYDKGNSWMHYNNIPTGEFYDITLDQKDPYTIYGGTQDDATVYGKAKEWNPEFYDEWKYLWIDPWSGGDGCITVIDPVDTNTLFYSSQEGGVRRMDIQTKESTFIRPRIDSLKDKLRYHFISPYFLSPHDHSTLYLGGNYVLKGSNHGDTWNVISHDLLVGKSKKKNSMAIGALAESELKKGLLFAGTDKGLFWVSENDGKTWQDRSSGLPDMYIRTIVPSRFNASRVYVAMSGINYDDFGTYLYSSDDNGKSWKKLPATSHQKWLM
ncbi:MAG: hypothetical protein HC811_06075 [Flammeovirgaceae bacterium]|nr:hypothetical protein [Flammeovirgaceae bacterium]